MPLGFSHSDYYRDRYSEYELCRDFPGDEILIHGLNAMQCHFWNNNVNIEIPIVRVMNTAHFLAAYMFATTCSGDQTEYDAMANMSLGRDKQLFKVAIIVLAAMLKRTDGFRANQCRNMLLDNRDPDFEEGVTLYERFLRSAEKRFSEEDFLIDTHTQIQKLVAQNEQLVAENNELKLKYQVMEQQNIQYKQDNNQGTIYNAPVYQYIYTQPGAMPAGPSVDTATTTAPAPAPSDNIPDSIIFTKKTKEEGKEAAIIQALQQSVNGRKDKTRAFVNELQTWQKKGYIDAHYNARVMYDELAKLVPISFGYESFKKHYNNTRE